MERRSAEKVVVDLDIEGEQAGDDDDSPVPMRQRSLPASFWREPNIPRGEWRNARHHSHCGSAFCSHCQHTDSSLPYFSASNALIDRWDSWFPRQKLYPDPLRWPTTDVPKSSLPHPMFAAYFPGAAASSSPINPPPRPPVAPLFPLVTERQTMWRPVASKSISSLPARFSPFNR